MQTPDFPLVELRKRITFPSTAIVVILVALLLVASACQARPSWSGSVKIGLIVPFYGYDSASANSVYVATKVAVKERNEGGGIGGRWVEMVVLDDQNTREVAAQKAREIAEDPDVLGVIGHLSSDAAMAAAASYRQAGLTAITLGGSAAELAWTYPEMLRMAPSDAAAAAQALEEIAKSGRVQRVAVASDSSPGHLSAARAFLDEAVRLKLQAAPMAEIGKDQRDFSSFFSDLSSNPPELLVFVGDQFQAASFASQARRSVVDARILIAGCANTPDFARIGGRDAIGVLHADYAVAGDSATMDRFADRYRSAVGLPPTAYAYAAYDAANLLLNAMENAAGTGGKPDRASVSRGLKRGGGSSMVGAFGSDGARLGVVSRLYEIDGSGYPGRLWR